MMDKRNPKIAHRSKGIVLFLIFCSQLLLCSAVSAKISPEPLVPCKSILGQDTKQKETDYIHFFLGVPAKNSIYLGLWSYHFVHYRSSYRTSHHLVGITYKGFYVGTFINSLDERSWSAGVQRDIYHTIINPFSVEVGYRLGLLQGYDKMQIQDTGLFPFVQMYSNLRYKKTGLQFSWAGSVLTAGLFINF